MDVVVSECSAVFELLSSKDEALLIWGNSFLVLDLGLDGFDGVGAFNIEGDGLAGKSLDEDLHTSTKAEYEMEGRLLLDIVVSKSTSVLELLSGENKPLLIRWDS